MGYEDRIYFVERYDNVKAWNTEGYMASSIIAVIEMCKMGYGDEVDAFRKLFDTDTDFVLSVDGTDIVEDPYGDHIKYASDKEALYKVARRMTDADEYRRFPWLEKMIEAFKDSPTVYIVHYGH